jgi:hypothetical protein
MSILVIGRSGQLAQELQALRPNDTTTWGRNEVNLLDEKDLLKKVQSLNVGEAQVLDFRFDQIGVGSQEPLSIYDIEIPGSYTIPPGNLAFVDRSVPRKIALRYGPSGGTQQNIIFVLPS